MPDDPQLAFPWLAGQDRDPVPPLLCTQQSAHSQTRSCATGCARGRIMSGYSLAQAAAAVGRNRSSVLRAIKAGKISAVRDEATGEWRIQPAELHRLYPNPSYG
jgi:hypothetical protein